MLPLQAVLLLLLATLAPPPVHTAQEVYLWYDENGQAVYSQFAPEPGRETRTVKPPPPPAESPEVARQRLQQQLQRLEDNREDQRLAAQADAQRGQQAAQARERCASARHNLQVLNGPARARLTGADGTVRRLSDEQRQQQRIEMEKIIAEECR